MIRYYTGDVLKAPTDIIVHGCNCFHTFGGGIAYQIKNQFPVVFEADLQTECGDETKLGSYSHAFTTHGVIFINAYTQFGFDSREVNVDYDAIQSVMKKIKTDFSPFYVISMPKIGCGLAGGDWNIVEKILNEVFDDRILQVYTLEGE